MKNSTLRIIGLTVIGGAIAFSPSFAQAPRGIWGGGGSSRPSGAPGVGSGFRIGPAPRPSSGGNIFGIRPTRPGGTIESSGGSISAPGRTTSSTSRIGGITNTEVRTVRVVPPSQPNTTYPPNQQPTKPNLDWLKPIIPLIIPPSHPEGQPQYPEYRPPNVIQQPPQVIPQPQAVAPPPNLVPKKPAEQPLDNLGGFYATADPALVDFVAEQNKQDALENVQKMEDDLDPALKTPAVMRALNDIRDKIRSDQPVTQADFDRLQKAIEAETKVPFTPGNAAWFKTFTEPIRQESLTAAILKASLAGGGGILPPGQVVVFPVGVWPGDVVLFVPGGDAVLVGTGGVPLSGTIATETDALGNAVGAGEPISNTGIAFGDRSKIAVYLTNPEQNGAAVSYLLNGSTYTIKPGYTQILGVGTAWEIQFDRGQGQGEARYGLQHGTYAFELSDRGWELRHIETVALTIDNTKGSSPFHYTKDDVRAQVGPGEAVTESSPNPILIRFNRGESGKIDAKLFCQSTQTALVAINPADGLLDLYPADLKQPTTTPPKVTPAGGGARTSQLLELLKQKKPDLAKPKSPLDLLKQNKAPDSVEAAKPGLGIEAPKPPMRAEEPKVAPTEPKP